MATVQAQLDNIVRVTLDDEIKSRWTDNQLLAFMKQAISRAQALGHQNRFEFARTKMDFTLPAGETQRSLPLDFLVQHGVWRKDTNKPIGNISIEQYEEEYYSGELQKYVIDDGFIEFNQGSESDVLIRLRYYQDVQPDSLTLSTNMPWGGKLDYPLCEYVRTRALNVDRFNTSPDAQLLMDMEERIVQMYQSLTPTMEDAQGAFK